MEISAPRSDAAAELQAPLLRGQAPVTDSAATALDVLLQRMQTRSDFPALSSTVTRIQRIAGSDTESVASLAAEILKDVALTHKLLRMVNTVHFSRAGSGGISTVSRAVALVGFANIRNMALSLVLLEGLQNKAQAVRLREEFVRSLVAGQLASELTPWETDAEEAYLAALFHNLGRMLTEFYLPDEARAIDQLCGAAAADKQGASAAASSEAAALQVLGLGFEALSVGVAKTWGLPEGLRKALRRPQGAAPTKPLQRGSERNRWLAALANDVALAMQAPDAEDGRRQVRRLAEQHARALNVTTTDICNATDKACRTVTQLAPAIGLPVLPGTPTHRLLSFSSTGTGAATGARLQAVPAGLGSGQEAPSSAIDAADLAVNQLANEASNQAASTLAAGIQEVMNTLAGDGFQLNAVLHAILQTMLQGLQLRRVVFCLRDPKTQHITGRFGLGAGVDTVVRSFVVDGKTGVGAGTCAAVDLFSAVCQRAVDTLIVNAAEDNIRQRLPAWFSGDVAAPSFLLLPLAMKGATFALIYADTDRAGGMALGEREMALVRTLRNQAVMAFRQST